MVLSLLSLAVAHTSAMQAVPEEAEILKPVHQLYAVISGPAGKARNWDEFRTLFAEGATMNATLQRQGKPAVVSMTTEDYIKRNSPAFETRPFFEKETKHNVQRFGLIANVWSTYESWSVDPATAQPTDKPFDRGVNSIQLIKTESGWKIQSLTWCAESAGFKLP